MEDMPERMKAEERTLKMKHLPGKTFWLTGFFLIILFGGSELLSRQESFQSLFIAPGIGSPHRQFEKQLGRLKRISQEEGKVDCILLGSSSVMEGFNPLVFQTAYLDKAEKELACFNFGVDGLTGAGAGILAQILVEKYQPRLIIYGTDPRDYSSPSDEWANTIVNDNPWVQYQLGNMSWSGWLYEHSALMQYQEPLREVLHLQFNEELLRHEDSQDTTRWGYIRSSTNRIDVATCPSQNLESDYVKAYYELLFDFQILPENLQGLDQVIAQQGEGVQVILLEMPVAVGYMDFFRNGELDYENWISDLQEIIEPYAIPLVRTRRNLVIPLEGWSDYNHLNSTGASLFSEWLGIEVSELYSDGIKIINNQ